MRWTDLTLGYSCNQQCRFCDQGAARESTGDAQSDAAKAAISAIAHRDGIILAGGEITLRRDLPALIAFAREAGFRRVAIQTNGRILSGKGAAASLKALGLTDVVLALHAPEVELHDWLTGTPGSFRLAIAAARSVVSVGLRLRITSVVCRSNVGLLDKMVRIAAELSASGLRFSLCREEGSATGEARMLVPRFELAGPAVIAALELARSINVDADVAGLPLCFLGEFRAASGDRRDGHAPERVSAVSGGISAERLYLAPCDGCQLRTACSGINAAYAARYGADELRPLGKPSATPAERAQLELCDANGPRSTRILRQALVKIQATGAKSITLVGEHPELATIRKEAERLGF